MNTNNKIKVLCADDEYIENNWEKRFKKYFSDEFHFIWTQYSDQVLPILKKEKDIKIIILDLNFKNQSLQGKDVLLQLKNSEFKDIKVIIFTVDDSPKTFLEISGLSGNNIYDYFIKDNIDYEEAEHILRYAKDNDENPNFLKGESEKIKNIKKLIRLYAKVDQENNPPIVLIFGETGTGKELVARSIHKYSPIRKKNKFIGLNIAAVPPTLIESELFGHVKGAFTDARKDRDGAFKTAKGGVLFLDEIGELPVYLQVKLLRILQEKEIQPIGSDTTINVDDVRIIAATNVDIYKYVVAHKFREDLFYRLYGCTIELPSLNERKEDIKTLVKYFLFKYHYLNQNILDIENDVLKKMETFDWEGNVRQLEKMIEKALILAHLDNAKILNIKHFPDLEIPYTKISDHDINELREIMKKIAKKIWLEIYHGKREVKTLDEIDKEFNFSIGQLVGMEAVKQFNGWLNQNQEEKYFGYKPSKNPSSRHLISYFNRRGIKSIKEIIKE